MTNKKMSYEEIVNFAEMAYIALDEHLYQMEDNENYGLDEEVKSNKKVISKIRKQLDKKLREYCILENETLCGYFSELALSVGCRMDNEKLLTLYSSQVKTDEEILKLKKYVDRIKRYDNDIVKLKEKIVIKMTELDI